MNISNLEHVAVFFLFALMWRRGLAYVWFFVAGIFVVELDQAFTYSHPFWLHFLQLDTNVDILAGLLGIGLAWPLGFINKHLPRRRYETQ